MGWMSQGTPGNVPPSGVSGDTRGASPKNGWWTGLVLAFCCWHAAFLAISIVPSPPESDAALHPALDFYASAFAGPQRWNVFETIPTLHSVDFRLEGEDENGNIVTHGCVLPDFKPYPKSERVRYYAGLYRMFSSDPFRDAYLQRRGQQLPAYV